MIFVLLVLLYPSLSPGVNQGSDILRLGCLLWAWCGIAVMISAVVYLVLRRWLKFQATLTGVFLAELFTAPPLMPWCADESLFGPPPFLLPAYVIGCFLGLLLLLPLSLPKNLPLRGKWLRWFLSMVALFCLGYAHPWDVMLVRYGKEFSTGWLWIEWFPTAVVAVVTTFFMGFAARLLSQQRTYGRRKTAPHLA